MNPVPNLAPEPSRPADAPARGPRRYTLGFTDGLGERLLTFDNSTGMSLELLRFKPEFGDLPGFEAALRQRVEQLSHLHHPALAVVREVERVEAEAGGGLAVVSKLTPGRRLSDLVPKARGPAFALDLIRQLTPALVALQQSSAGTVHGALSVDRIVVAREGRLVVVEQVLGAALALLKLPASRLRSDLGLAVPSGTDPIALDARLDVIQLGFIALSLLLGRRLEPAGYPGNVNALLDEFTKADPAGSSAQSRLRFWLERTLQIGSRPFGSAQEAHDALSELPETVDADLSEPARAVLAFPTETPATPAPAALAPERKSDAARVPGKTSAPAKDAPAPAAAQKSGAAPAADAKSAAAARPAATPADAKRTGGWSLGKLLLPALATLVVAEGGVIAALYYSRPAPLVIEVAAPTPSAAALARAAAALPPAVPDLRPDGATSGAGLPGFVAPVASKPAGETAAPAAAMEPPPVDRPATAGPRFGAVRIQAAIELQVFEAGRLLGSTASPIAINEGPHTVELVNDQLGYRSQQTVNVRAGQMAAVTIALPNGRVSINAVPWAEVWIDGNAAGQTPIANFALPIGQHEILFRHPQFGEQRQTALVKSEGLTRVSATFQR